MAADPLLFPRGKFQEKLLMMIGLPTVTVLNPPYPLSQKGEDAYYNYFFQPHVRANLDRNPTNYVNFQAFLLEVFTNLTGNPAQAAEVIQYLSLADRFRSDWLNNDARGELDYFTEEWFVCNHSNCYSLSWNRLQ
jgi:hypothetical protein